MFTIAAPSRADDSRIAQSFSLHGVERVVLRSAQAKQAVVTTVEAGEPIITVSGNVAGGAAGYHSPDPNWKETPASQWGMKFVAKQFGPVLVVSSQSEVGYIHHQYTVENITVQLPRGIQLVLEQRVLSGSGEPDLHSP
ncbi:hypothetical protein AACH06_29265 [Ideonella sp. DXS29W]|uniref:Uncharacterized protein n=1 Tax=Ideonella lacteola TaxID=2984193 RepID=A0ABU9C250_9BURK